MADSYLWPLPASDELTSGFCSYRSTHFHSGIDIRTFGKTGYEAVAISDCYVWRIATNWYGYGKALYLKLADNRIAVNAHLQKFAPEIDEYVKQQQVQARRYKTDLYPDSSLFRFKAGEVVAFTGESGAGAPHLHFEIRTEDNVALSPLEFYPEVVDNLPPIIRAVLCTPLSASESRINGRSKTIRLTPGSYKGMRLFRDTLTTYGPVGISVDCIDRIPGSSVDLSPARIELSVDSSANRLFASVFDSIPFDRWGEINIERDYALARKGERQVHTLYVIPGAAPTVVTDFAENNGWLQAADGKCIACLAPGFHRVLISVTDRAGNVSKAEIPIVIRAKPPSPFDASERADSVGARYEIVRFDRKTKAFRAASKMDSREFSAFMQGLTSGSAPQEFEIALVTQRLRDGSQFHYLATPAAFKTESVLRGVKVPQYVLSAKAVVSWHKPLRIDLGKLYDWQYEQSLILPSAGFAIPVYLDQSDSSISVDITRVYSSGQPKLALRQPFIAGIGGADVTNSETADVSLSIDSGDFFAAAAISVDTSSRIVRTHGRVSLTTLSPSDLWLKGSIELSLPIPPGLDASRCAIYAIGEDGSAAYAGATMTESGYLRAEITSFRSYGVLEDKTPPSIREVAPRNGGAVLASRPKISFRLTDDLSGIGDDTNVEITVDGIWVIPDYDTESLWMTAYPAKDLSLGDHALVIRVRDRAGNEKVVSSQFKRVKSTSGRK
jgi:hypothetical protein